jgi:CheY-like chemotaxis protein
MRIRCDRATLELSSSQSQEKRYAFPMGSGKARVFVVEDHPATARGLKMFLELSGHTVEIAKDMSSALGLARKIEFDVLLCDLSLPDGNGWELMERLTALRPIRGIAFSAFHEPEHIAASIAAGFIEHVVKGTTPEDLVAAIDRVMQQEPKTASPSKLTAVPAL